jgi:multidrug efflux pump subunit AcrA (membrane-fusion protein)
LEGQPVTVDVVITRDEKKQLTGKVVYVSPLTDSGDTYMVRAKLDNKDHVLSPGMQAEMNIELGKK